MRVRLPGACQTRLHRCTLGSLNAGFRWMWIKRKPCSSCQEDPTAPPRSISTSLVEADSYENLTWEHHLLHITKKVSQKIGALARASQQLTINAKRTFYLSVLASDIEYGSNAFYSSLSTAFKEKLVQLSKRGVRAIFKAPPWTPSAPLYEQLNIATPLKRFEYKLIYFTYRCTHSLASTLLVNQYIILSQSKARTSSITRGQSSVKLALCKVKTRSGSVSPLFTSSLLWNSLPSALRQPDLSSSQFSHLLYLYLGFPVNRHF